MSENWKNFLKAFAYSYGLATVIFFSYFLFDTINEHHAYNDSLWMIFISLLMPIVFIYFTLLATFFFNPLYGVLLIAYFGAFILLFKSQHEMKENNKIGLLTVLMTVIHLISNVIVMQIMPNFIV